MKPEFDDSKTEGRAASHGKWPLRGIITKVSLQRRGHQYNPERLILILYSNVQLRVIVQVFSIKDMK